MKLSKRSWIGLSAAAGASVIGGSALYWLPGANDNSETASPDTSAEFDADLQAAIPLPLRSDDGALPLNPIRQVDFEVPSPTDTVVRGNEPPESDPPVRYGSDAPEPQAFDPMSEPAPANPVRQAAPIATQPSAPPTVEYQQPPAYSIADDSVSDPPSTNQQPTASGNNPSFNPYGDTQPIGSPAYGDARSAALAETSPATGRYSVSTDDSSESPAPNYASPTYANDANRTSPPASFPSSPPQSASQPTPPAAFARESVTTSISAGPIAGSGIINSPGPRQLEGMQAPSLSIEKVAPEEIQVNIPATFETLVRNVGEATASSVILTDVVPLGTQLIKTTPDARQTPDGQLVWQLGDLEPGDEILVTVQLLPQAEGEIGSVAQVMYQTQASVRTVCTRPMLAVEHSAPARVLIGDDVAFSITIKNPGSGDATNVVIEEDVPTGLAHSAGRALEYELGTLRAGDERQLELILEASEAGIVENTIRISGNGELVAEHRLQLEVTAPQLQVAVRGPTRRYLERQVTYEVLMANEGTASATNVDVITYLPKGLEFVSADNKGKYDDQSHAVFWSLEELPADEMGTVHLTAMPIETGDQMLRVEGRADLSLTHQFDHTTIVEALTELEFTVQDDQDPIEVGSETTYEIRILNRGSKAATNVQLSALLPPQITPLAADGHTRVAIQGQQVAAEAIDQLAPQAEAIYRIKVQGRQPGDHLINVQLVSADVPTPVTKQESTKVYSDQ
jgi:uncharacterized repeat protein (TIGR01451 family)